jgi:hypothetical protein
MFGPLTTEIDSRFQAVEAFFAATKDFKGDVAATAKGMMFVQIYAVYEFTVSSVIQTAVDVINSQAYKLKEIRPSLMALLLDPELSSLKDSGQKNIWKARLKIFERTFSEDLLSFSGEAPMPSDGSHYRHTHLIMIFSVFGIRRLPARRRIHLYRIDEIVDHRNQIAHGSETAAEIGRRYTRSDIRERIGQMRSVCHFLVTVFDSFCSDPASHKRA